MMLLNMEKCLGVGCSGADESRVILRFSVRDGVLIKRQMSSVHVFMDGETRFPGKSFKLSISGFHGAEIRGETRRY